jgi:D-xylose transport system ATP-binding protein
MTTVLAARSLTKRFPGVVALRDVTFELRAGEVHALCGENGAGKSTLIKLLAGIHAHGSYDGSLEVDGAPAAFGSIRDAESAGIAVITQEFALIDELSVAENIFLGREPRRGWRIDLLEMNRRAAALLQEFGLTIAPDTPVRRLGVGQKQLVEILRAVDKRSRILVLDEPTAALTEQEVSVLLAHLRRLRAQGTACIYISHKLDEVLAIADRITVLRDGASIRTYVAAGTTTDELIRTMVGRELGELFPKSENRSASATHAPLLKVKRLGVAPVPQGGIGLHDISFDLHAGEVLGIGGLMGAGRTELLLHLFGAGGERTAGEVWLGGQRYDAPSPRSSIQRGLVLATEDRRRHGLVLGQSVGFNLSLASLGAFTSGLRLDEAAEFARNRSFFTSLRIMAPDLATRVGGLSGGNQQKVVLGKALMPQPQVVMIDEPTRGIDIGAKAEIYSLIRQLTEEGKAVLLVSSELPELMGLSDRIVMLSRGAVGGSFVRKDFTQETLLAAAMGRAA